VASKSVAFRQLRGVHTKESLVFKQIRGVPWCFRGVPSVRPIFASVVFRGVSVMLTHLKA
jgi:hypothetical protein